MVEQKSKLEPLVKAVVTAVESTLAAGSGLKLTQDSESEIKDIIEYESHMRVFGLDKFNAVCFISYVNFFASEAQKEAGHAHGALVLFITQENAPKLLKGLGFRGFDENNEEECAEKVGEACTRIAEQFLKSAGSLGYSGLFMSEPVNQINDIPDGVPFKFSETEKINTLFYLWKEPTLSVEVTLPPPK